MAGYGTCEALRGEFDGLGLSPAGKERLEDIVCPHDAKKGKITGPACPVG
jgi:hypothetical protein